MMEWKKAKKLVEYREPIPNTHEWKYDGRTPQGGLSGGDDVHKCKLCGKTNIYEKWNDSCWEGKKGKTEAVELTPNRYNSKKERAILGTHTIIKDQDKQHVITIEDFEKYYETEVTVR